MCKSNPDQNANIHTDKDAYQYADVYSDADTNAYSYPDAYPDPDKFWQYTHTNARDFRINRNTHNESDADTSRLCA